MLLFCHKNVFLVCIHYFPSTFCISSFTLSVYFVLVYLFDVSIFYVLRDIMLLLMTILYPYFHPSFHVVFLLSDLA